MNDTMIAILIVYGVLCFFAGLEALLHAPRRLDDLTWNWAIVYIAFLPGMIFWAVSSLIVLGFTFVWAILDIPVGRD